MRVAPRARVFASLLALLAVAPAFADDCSGHGVYDESGGKCVCDTPTPSPGASGFTGDSCEIQTVGVATPTVSAPARLTGELSGGQWRCYFFPVPLPENGGWRFLSVALQHAAMDAGDPDVHGLFFDPTSRAAYPKTETSAYDFHEVSSASHQVVDVQVARGELGGGEIKNTSSVFICVQAYGAVATEYTLTAAFSTCPSSFANEEDVRNVSNHHAAVKLLECSVTTPADTQPAGRCDAATGTCECAAYDDHTFVPPSDGDGDYANSGMYSSTQLGFGACAARIDFVDLGVGADSQSRGKVFHNQTLSPGRWRFYKFDVDPANDHQVVISMNKEISAGSWEKNYASLYVRHETVPTNHWGHYDLPQDFVTGADASVLVTLTEGDEIYQPGTWYAGVFASGGTDASFTVSFDVFDCPMNCSDRGTCVVAANGTRVCHCDLDRNGNPYLKNDCSEEFSNWLPGGDEDENGAASFRVNGTLASAEYDYFALPVMDLRESKRQIELVLSASFSKENLMYDWEEKPALLLKKGLIGDDNGRNQFPSITDYAFKVTLDEFDVEYKIELCAAQFATGVWNAAVYNPERVEPMRYTVSFRKHGVCPSVNELECSGHGACRANDASDPNFATCDCHAGWTASDCAFPSCPDGSFIKLPPGTDGGDHATCFRGCQGGKRRATGCDEILCVSPARAAEGSGETGEKKCVVDECESDLFHVDQDKDLSCVFRCAADSGDLLSPKRLSETCDPATVRSNANAISGDNDDGGATGWWTLAFVVALLVAVGGGAVAVARGAAGDQSVGDRLARFVTYVRNGFTIDTWDRRNDAYEDVDAFERADFD